MSSTYPIKDAPFLGTVFIKDVAKVIDFNAEDLGDRVRLTWKGVPWPAGYVPGTLTVGKEYPDTDLQEDAKECSGQLVACVPHPDNLSNPLPHCYTKTWDSVVAFTHFSNPQWPFVDGHCEVAYNDFVRAGNNAAFQTDGLTKQYYMEVVAYANNGSNQKRVKWLFDFKTPVAKFDPCGVAAPVTPASPSTPAGSDKPGKGQGNKPVK